MLLCYTATTDRSARMNIVELNQISKIYDTKVAVDALSLQIEAGQMFGLLGPDGAGKTSTIRGESSWL
jgi:ABC-2 type transport system ATP-binding protein